MVLASENQREQKAARVLSDKIDSKPRMVKRHKEGHRTMIKGSISKIQQPYIHTHQNILSKC